MLHLFSRKNQKLDIMKKKILGVVATLCLTSFVSCSQDGSLIQGKEANPAQEKAQTQKAEHKPHRYGGWYCPDNVVGLPAVNIENWKTVPVVDDRMPTKEDTKQGASLIFVDPEEYPNAQPLDMQLPRLAKFYTPHVKREDLVIIIQAFRIGEDSIVGFRYLNGGNGSAHFREVNFLTDTQIDQIPKMRFVSFSIEIQATQEEIYKVLTNPEKAQEFNQVFDEGDKLKKDWRSGLNVNYYYPNPGVLISSYSDRLFGSFYIQNDYHEQNYTQKFLLMEDSEKKTTELKIVCGPYGSDYEDQKRVIAKWAQKVKELSE